MAEMKAGEKYLSGHIFGLVDIYVFPNKKRDPAKKQPTHHIVVKKGEKLVRVGALWVNIKKEDEEMPDKDDMVW